MPETTELSERELEILKLVATGASNKEIAHALVISANTVKVHLRNIFGKIGAASRTEAAMYAVRIGLVEGLSADVEGMASEDALVARVPSDGILAVSQYIPESQMAFQWRRLAGWMGLAFIIFTIVSGYLLFRAGQSRGQMPDQTLLSSLSASQTPGLSPAPTSTSDASPEITAIQPGWTNRRPLSLARQGLATAVYEGLIYAIAGEFEAGVTGSSERYDPGLDQWEALPAKPLAVADVSAAVLGGRIYVPGGRQASGEVSPRVEVFDPRAQVWGQGTPLPIAVSAYSLLAFEGKLYLFGGWDGKKYLDTVLEYDPGSDRWEQGASMPTARGFSAAVEAGGRLYIIGGYDGERALDTVEIYQPSLKNESEGPWQTGSPLPAGRYAMGAANVVEAIHIIGGKYDDRAEGFYSLIYNPQRNEWQKLALSPDQQPRAHLSLVYLNRFLYLIGGEILGKPTALNQDYQILYTVSIPVIR
jgi:DNA-binding CsgD family transcriptional regulator/N-acetylneuraminic acid mutarotase